MFTEMIAERAYVSGNQLAPPDWRSSDGTVLGSGLAPNHEDALAELVAKKRVESARRAYH
jgi:hypothetical protein